MNRLATLAILLATTLMVGGCTVAPRQPGPPPAAPLAQEPERNPATFRSDQRYKIRKPGQYPFFIAHRGSGREQPELTMCAYDEAAKNPDLKLVELSVRQTKDGVLIAAHDDIPSRVTDGQFTHSIAKSTWSEIQKITVRGPGGKKCPFTQVSEILKKYGKRFTFFVEYKGSLAANQKAYTKLFDLVDKYVGPKNVIFKTYGDHCNALTWAKERGYLTWAYSLDKPGEFTVNCANIDAIGLGLDYSLKGLTEEAAKKLVDEAHSRGLLVISWQVNNQDQINFLDRIGVDGLMTARTGLLAQPYQPR